MKSFKKIIWQLKNEIGIISILCCFIILGLLMWQLSIEFRDFGLNFFTEMLGVLITILIIDRLIQKREKKRLLPYKMTIYEDVRRFTGNYIGFWTQTYIDSVPEKYPKTLYEFFTRKEIKKIFRYLDLDSKPNHIYHNTWWTYLESRLTEIQKIGDKILTRHTHHLEPEVYDKIHYLIDRSFNLSVDSIEIIKEVDSKSKFPRATNLGSYHFLPSQQEFDSILFLFDWCETKYEDYKKVNKEVLRVFNYNTMLERSEETLKGMKKPINMLSNKKRKKQNRAEEKYRKIDK